MAEPVLPAPVASHADAGPPASANIVFTWTGRVNLAPHVNPWCARSEDGDAWFWGGVDGHWARADGVWASTILAAAGAARSTDGEGQIMARITVERLDEDRIRASCERFGDLGKVFSRTSVGTKMSEEADPRRALAAVLETLGRELRREAEQDAGGRERP